MIPLVSRWQTPLAQRRILRGLLTAALVLCLIYSQRSGDFQGYLIVGELVLNGDSIYLTPLNTWPPFFSLICVPLALLAAPTPYLARIVWIVLNLISLIGTVGLLARLIYQRPFSLTYRPSSLSFSSAELLLPLALTSLYISGNFEDLQINLILFALTLAGLWQCATQRVLPGSLLIALAASIKVMPFAFVPYFIYKRQIKAALYTTLATATLSLSPILVFGWSGFWNEVGGWCLALDTGWSVGQMNQSVFAMLDRVIGHGLIPLAAPGANRVPPSQAVAVTVLWIAFCIVAIALCAYLFRPPTPPLSQAALAEWSIVFIFAALFGTVSWKAYLVVLLLPNTLLFSQWYTSSVRPRTGRGYGVLLLTIFALGSLHARDLWGRHLAGRFEMASCVTIAALILLGGLMWYRYQLGRQRTVCMQGDS